MTLRYVCEIVSTRAADLASAGVSTLVRRMGEKCRKKVTVGVDGTVYKLHPQFAKKMKERCRDLAPDTIEVNLMLSEDGSGRGAALVAAVAASQNKPPVDEDAEKSSKSVRLKEEGDEDEEDEEKDEDEEEEDEEV